MEKKSTQKPNVAKAGLEAVTPLRTIKPALNPGAIRGKSEFLSTYQGTPTNLLGTFTGRGALLEINLNDQATLTRDKLTVFIDRYSELTSGLKNSTVKLLQACIMRLSAINSFRNETAETIKKEITFHINDYIELRELKDRKEARRQITADLLTLYNTSLGWVEKSGKNVRAFDMTRICSRASLERNGTIHFHFTEEMALYLVNAYEMKLPRLYWKLNDKRNPNSSPLLWKLSLQKKMNAGKAAEDIHSVRTLLDNAPAIPPYDDLPRKNEVQRTIIEPLERDLNALTEVLHWEYCNNGGEPLSEEQLSGFDYSVFIDCYVKVRWKNYPAKMQFLPMDDGHIGG